MSKHMSVPSFRSAALRALRLQSIAEKSRCKLLGYTATPRVCTPGPLKEVIESLPAPPISRTQIHRISHSQSMLDYSKSLRPIVSPTMLRTPVLRVARSMATLPTPDIASNGSNQVFSLAVARRRAEEAKTKRIVEERAKTKLTERLLSFLGVNKVRSNTDVKKEAAAQQRLYFDTPTASIMRQQQEKSIREAVERVISRHEQYKPELKKAHGKFMETPTAAVLRQANSNAKMETIIKAEAEAEAETETETEDTSEDDDDKGWKGEKSVYSWNTGGKKNERDLSNYKNKIAFTARSAVSKICASVRSYETVESRWRRMTSMYRF